MTALFWVYFCTFIAVSAVGVIDSIKSRRGAVLLVLEVAAAGAAAAGMLLYWFDLRFSTMPHVWKLVFVFILLVESWVAVTDVRDARRDSSNDSATVLVGGLLAAAVVLPSLWMNWRLAFGGAASVS